MTDKDLDDKVFEEYKKGVEDSTAHHENLRMHATHAMTEAYMKVLHGDWKNLEKVGKKAFIDEVYKIAEEHLKNIHDVHFGEKTTEFSKRSMIGDMMGIVEHQLTKDLTVKGGNYKSTDFLNMAYSHIGQKEAQGKMVYANRLDTSHADKLIKYHGLEGRAPDGYEFNKEAFKSPDTFSKVLTAIHSGDFENEKLKLPIYHTKSSVQQYEGNQ